MKRYILCTAVICLVFSSGAQAKGCIKGALSVERLVPWRATVNLALWRAAL